MQNSEQMYYFLYFCFFFPWLLFYGAFLQKWSDTQFKGDRWTVIFGSASVVFSFAMGAFLIWARSLAAGLGVIGFYFFFYFFHYVYQVYNLNNKSLPRRYRLIVLAIIVLVCLSTLIAAVCISSFNDFVGFSLTWLGLNAILFVYSLNLVRSDWDLKRVEPLYVSPWVFPVYKYEVKTKRVLRKNK